MKGPGGHLRHPVLGIAHRGCLAGAGSGQVHRVPPRWRRRRRWRSPRLTRACTAAPAVRSLHAGCGPRALTSARRTGRATPFCSVSPRSPTHRACDMDKIIVYVDDADHAQQLLAPLAAKGPPPAPLGAGGLCAAHDAPRQQMGEPQRPRNWRNKWADKLFAQIIPGAGLQPSQVTTVLAKIPLAELTEQLQSQTNRPAAARPGAGCANPHGHRSANRRQLLR